MDFTSPRAHGFVKVAAASPELSLADPLKNVPIIIEQAAAMASEGAAVGVFPELSLCGVTSADLLSNQALLDACEKALAQICAATAQLSTILLIGVPLRLRGGLSAALAALDVPPAIANSANSTNSAKPAGPLNGPLNRPLSGGQNRALKGALLNTAVALQRGQIVGISAQFDPAADPLTARFFDGVSPLAGYSSGYLSEGPALTNVPAGHVAAEQIGGALGYVPSFAGQKDIPLGTALHLSLPAPANDAASDPASSPATDSGSDFDNGLVSGFGSDFDSVFNLAIAIGTDLYHPALAASYRGAELIAHLDARPDALPMPGRQAHTPRAASDSFQCALVSANAGPAESSNDLAWRGGAQIFYMGREMLPPAGNINHRLEAKFIAQWVDLELVAGGLNRPGQGLGRARNGICTASLDSIKHNEGRAHTPRGVDTPRAANTAGGPKKDTDGTDPLSANTSEPLSARGADCQSANAAGGQGAGGADTLLTGRPLVNPAPWVSPAPFVDLLRPGLFHAFNMQVNALIRRMRAVGNPRLVLGVSGGLDSTLALLVCFEACRRLHLEPAHIAAYTMPGFGTSPQTKSNAVALCEALGMPCETLDIRPAATQMLKDMGHPAGHGEKQYDITFENVQAGLRTDYLFRLANHLGGMVVGTGDMSEIALGWCTYGVGDHMAHYGVNAGLPKGCIQLLTRHFAQVLENRAASAGQDPADRDPVVTAEGCAVGHADGNAQGHAVGRATGGADRQLGNELERGAECGLDWPLDWGLDAAHLTQAARVLHAICDTEITPELIPIEEGKEKQATQKTVGPYVLHDFFLYHTLASGFAPRKIAYLAGVAFGAFPATAAPAATPAAPVNYVDSPYLEDSVFASAQPASQPTAEGASHPAAPATATPAATPAAPAPAQFTMEQICHWLRVFYKRFVTQQFKRSTSVGAPRIFDLPSLSVRGDWIAPADASPGAFLAQLDALETELAAAGLLRDKNQG